MCAQEGALALPVDFHVNTHRAHITRSLSATFLFTTSKTKSSHDCNSASFALRKCFLSSSVIFLPLNIITFLVATCHFGCNFSFGQNAWFGHHALLKHHTWLRHHASRSLRIALSLSLSLRTSKIMSASGLLVEDAVVAVSVVLLWPVVAVAVPWHVVVPVVSSVMSVLMSLLWAAVFQSDLAVLVMVHVLLSSPGRLRQISSPSQQVVPVSLVLLHTSSLLLHVKPTDCCLQHP